MPNFVPGAVEKSDDKEAQGQEGTEEGFDLSKVRENLAAVRAAETGKRQRDSDRMRERLATVRATEARVNHFDLDKTRERLAAVRAAEAQRKQ